LLFQPAFPTFPSFPALLFPPTNLGLSCPGFSFPPTVSRHLLMFTAGGVCYPSPPPPPGLIVFQRGPFSNN
jgi:hypothetical protein